MTCSKAYGNSIIQDFEQQKKSSLQWHQVAHRINGKNEKTGS